MTKQVRDWNKDMELCERMQRNEGWSVRDQIAEQPQMSIYWLQQYVAEKERADEAEAQEKKLREAIEEVLRDATKWENPYEGYNDLQKVLGSLYPKEEEA